MSADSTEAIEWVRELQCRYDLAAGDAPMELIALGVDEKLAWHREAPYTT